MEKNTVKEEIVELLEIIVEQSEMISNHNGRIPQIEIDIVLSNIRELYDKYRNLEKLNNTQADISSPKKEEKTKYETVVKPLIKEDKTEEKKIIYETPVIIKEIKTKEPVIVQETLPLANFPSDENKAEEPKVEQNQSQKKSLHVRQTGKIKKPTVDLFSSHTTVADKFKDDKKSLNEKLSTSQSDKSIAARLQKNPIKDLKVAIGINEKFKFINELFEGNLQKYNEGITKLNDFNNIDDANKFISILKEEFSWGNDNEAFLELAELISRRFQK